MAEAVEEQPNPNVMRRRRRRRGRTTSEESPASAILTPESNFSSPFSSSASASVERCSFASSSSDISPNLTARAPTREAQKEDKSFSTTSSRADSSARNSFSLALKECQERRSRSDRRRPASMDLNVALGAAILSPAPEKISSSRRPAGGNLPSPATPGPHRVMTKGWSSERIPPPSSSARRGYNPAGRAVPSKWEDAERWICSPVAPAQPSGPNGPPKPKAKSGPLGPPGLAYHHSLYSPLPGGSSVPAYDLGSGNPGVKFLAGPSPFSAGTTTHVRLPTRNEPCIARSVSVHGCSEMVALQSLTSHEFADAATDIPRSVSRRDMATQMSPEGSGHSSPDGRLSFSALTPSALPIIELELQNIDPSKCDVRDVQVDEMGVTVSKWPKRYRSRNRKKCSEIIDDWMGKTGDHRSLSLDMSDAAKSISKSKREEAKINAWENLQKAKAEAAIRKLEMKLEKKRSSSMDKIMNKLRSAQRRAQEMRSLVLSNQGHQVSKTSRKAIVFRRTCQMSSLSGCFTCHAS